MDPNQQQGDQLNQCPTNSPSDTPNQTAPDRQQQPQYLSGYTVITPNESKRNKTKEMAKKEEDDLQRWKEAKKSVPVHINPERVGGSGTHMEARERQFREQACSKAQKKLKREEEKKRLKAQEEMEIQKMKDIQREKAERLEQKKQQQEKMRRELFQSDHARARDKFLQQFETKASSSRGPAPIPNTRDVPNVLPKNLEVIQQDQKRKNAEFLDNLERRMGASNMSGAASSSPSESLDQESSSRPRVSPGPRSAGHTAGEDEPNTEQDFDWALMKLVSNFPHCDKDVLRDILSQCSGDYQQAHGLLSLS